MKIYAFCLISITWILCFSHSAKAQNNSAVSFEVISAYSTVGLEETFELKFTINNAQFDNFQAPYLQDFTILQGPMTQSSLQIINGLQTSSYTYSYFVKAKDLGIFEIPAIEAETTAGLLISNPITINVVEHVDRPNAPSSPYGFHSNPFGNDNMQSPFGKDPFNDDFFKQFDQDNFFNFQMPDMPNIEDMMKQYEHMFDLDLDQMIPPHIQPKKEKKEKTYKL